MGSGSIQLWACSKVTDVRSDPNTKLEGSAPEEDGEGYILTVHGMIHHKELPEKELRFLCGLAAVEFDADLADKNDFS